MEIRCYLSENSALLHALAPDSFVYKEGADRC